VNDKITSLAQMMADAVKDGHAKPVQISEAITLAYEFGVAEGSIQAADRLNNAFVAAIKEGLVP
jgi:hypothetical protein